jgi:hypothetical protein
VVVLILSAFLQGEGAEIRTLTGKWRYQFGSFEVKVVKKKSKEHY